MTSITPTKLQSSVCYTPKELATPNKDNSEVSKKIFMHVSNLHNLLSNWIKLTDKGTKLCKSISALKLHECNDSYYPHQTKALTESLLEVLDGLKNVVDGVEILNNQLKALAKLQPQGCPVIFTWTASQISENVSRIYTSVRKEYELKHIITGKIFDPQHDDYSKSTTSVMKYNPRNSKENIAHCRDENLIEVYVSAWEFDVYLNIESSEYLFAETGLPGIT